MTDLELRRLLAALREPPPSREAERRILAALELAGASTEPVNRYGQGGEGHIGF